MMVKEVKVNGKVYYQCEACLMYYKTHDLAQRCEDFCKKFNACNMEIILHAVKLPGVD